MAKASVFYAISVTASCLILASSQPTVKTYVGEQVVELCCPAEHDTAAPVWQINSTIYLSNRLSNDYYITVNFIQTRCYQFLISQVKLWMDATRYSCYYPSSTVSRLSFILSVSFEFKGPSQYTLPSGNRILLHCSTSQISRNESSVFWKINDIFYNPVTLLPKYVMVEEGIQIVGDNVTDYVTFQCLIYSPMLYKDRFFESEIANISTASITSMNDISNTALDSDNEPLPTFFFKYQEFLFLNDSIRIAWVDATDCGSSVSYSLVKELESSSVRRNIGTNNLAIINRDELMNGSQYYSYYVEAYRENMLCMISEVKLQMSPTLFLQPVIKNPYETLVVNASSIGEVAIWPKSNGSYESCMCAVHLDITQCSCFEDGNVYNVTNNKLSVFWNNLPNSTKIYFVFQDSGFAKNYGSVPQYLPAQTILNAYIVILIGLPEPPTVTSSRDNPYKLCFVDNYDGYAPIQQYFINVTDNTGYTYSSPIPYKNEVCVTLPLEPSFCGQIAVQSQSKNEIGKSRVDATILNQDPQSEDKCQCFNHNVQIYLQDFVMSQNDVTLNVTCTTQYNMDISDINFAVKLIDQGTAKSEVQAKCFDQVTLPNLSPETTYDVKLNWKIECSDLGTSHMVTTLTQKTSSLVNLNVIYAGFGSVMGLLVIVLVIVCVILFIFIKIKWKNK